MAHIEDRWHRDARLADGGTRRERTARYGTGKRWRARYLDPDSREWSRSFATKVMAERFLTEVEHSKNAGYSPVAVALPWRSLDAKPVTARLLFTTVEGRAITRTPFVQKHWHRALREAGIAVERANGFHALRHYFASTLLYDGVDIRALAVYLGHHDPAFTLRVYAHLVPDAADRMRAVIDRAARGEADGPVTAPGMVR